MMTHFQILQLLNSKSCTPPKHSPSLISTPEKCLAERPAEGKGGQVTLSLSSSLILLIFGNYLLEDQVKGKEANIYMLS